MAKLYCQITGPVLLLVGVLGIVNFGIAGLLSINEPAEIALHLVLGALASYAGFSAGGYGRFALLYAKVFGIVYILLGLVGFILPDVIPGLIHLDLGCNVVHLVLGLWGIWAGYLTAEARQAVASA